MSKQVVVKMNLAIRVSRAYDEIRQWIEAFTATSVIAYQHEADDDVSRTHVHILVLETSIKPDALKARFKTLYGNIDKTDWSFASGFKDDGKVLPITAESSQKFITYMSKGKLTPVYSVGHDPEAVLRLTQEWKEPKKQLVTKGGKFVRVTEDVPDKPKKTKRTLIEIMLDRGKDQDLQYDDTQGILRMIRDVLVENNEVIGMYKVMEYYDSWMMYGQKDAFVNMVAKKIENRLMR